MNNPPESEEAVLPKLFAAGRRLVYKRKELIYRQGDVPSGVYFIRSGVVKVYTLDSRADENIVFTLGPGRLLLLDWAVSGNAPDICIAAMTPVEMLRLNRQDFMAHCLDGRVAVLLLREITTQCELLLDNITNLDYRSARQRIVGGLLRTVQRHGEHRGGLLFLDKIHTSHGHMASSMRLARETVTRELNRLEALGLIRRLKKDIIIPDVTKLAQAAGLELPV